MCDRVMLLVGVSPVTVNAKANVPPVMALLASRVGVKVIVAVPVPPDSALLTGGTSFAARRSATNTSGWFVGAAGLLSSSHAAAPNAHAASRSTPHRFIVPPVAVDPRPAWTRSEERRVGEESNYRRGGSGR